MDETFKIGLKAKLQHGVLLEAITARGWNHVQAAEFIGVPNTTFGGWINLKKVPVRLTEQQIQKLLELTGRLPEDLWPDYTRSQDFLDAPKDFVVIKEVTPQMLLGVIRKEIVARPDEIFTRKELSGKIAQVLTTLRPREVKVLRARFYEDKTLEEIAAEMGTGRERIRQIEAKALRKLRQPACSRKLQTFIEANYVEPKDDD